MSVEKNSVFEFMDQSATISSSTEDLCSIDTADFDNMTSPLSFPSHQMDNTDLNIQNEELQRQVEELTKQLNESMNKNFDFEINIFVR